MYIAVCDDLISELERVEEILIQWKNEKQAPLRYRCFPDASALLDAVGEEKCDL